MEVSFPASQTDISISIASTLGIFTPASTVLVNQHSIDHVVEIHNFSLNDTKMTVPGTDIKALKVSKYAISSISQAAKDDQLSAPTSKITPSKASPEKKNSCGCKLDESIWIDKSASAMHSKAPNRVPGNDSTTEIESKRPTQIRCPSSLCQPV